MNDHRPSIVFLHSAEPESSIHERLAPRLRPLTARFVDPALEREFVEDDLTSGTRAYLRFAVALAGLTFLLYGIHDAFVVPAHRALAWALRYGIFLPVAAVTFAVVSSRHVARWHQPILLLFGMSANLVVLAIGAVAPPEGFFIYTSFAILFVTLGPFIGRMSVVTQAVYTLATLALYDVLDALFTHSSMAVRASMNLTFFSMGAIGTLVAHQLASRARQAFLQRRIIREQVEELESEHQRADALLLNILPAPIARRLKLETRAIAEGFRESTVMFADIVGFTKMSARLTPEELVRRLNQIFSAFDDMVDELDLVKIKTIGDAYMVAGGLHDRHASDHAVAVAEMALRMLEQVERYSAKIDEPLSIRIGIHTGPVVAGVIGKRKFIYDVWGDTVNTASRMESHGVPGRIQVSEITHERLASAFEFEDRGELDIKGKGAMHTWLLAGRKRVSTAS